MRRSSTSCAAILTSLQEDLHEAEESGKQKAGAPFPHEASPTDRTLSRELWARTAQGADMILPKLEEDIVHVRLGELELEGALGIPQHSKGLVLFAHGSGSSRLSPRNQFVAHHLQASGLGTFLVDLLSPDEDRDYAR